MGPAGSAVSLALRSGALTPKQAALVSQATAAPMGPADRAAIVEHARGVTLRRLEDELGGLRPEQTAVVPREAASVFLLALDAVRRHLAAAGGATDAPASSPEHALRWMLGHVIAAWQEQGAQFDDYADFGRDGFRCTAPGCTGRRNLQSHHIVFRSAGGSDAPSNRTTLCAFHHLRGIHAGTVSCRGQAPDRLVFALGLRAASGDVLLRT